MTLVRMILIALAVLLAPMASVAHAGGADHAMHEADAPMAMEMPSADATDCCEASGQRTASACGLDLVALPPSVAVRTLVRLDRPAPCNPTWRNGAMPEALLDPPRL